MVTGHHLVGVRWIAWRPGDGFGAGFFFGAGFLFSAFGAPALLSLAPVFAFPCGLAAAFFAGRLTAAFLPVFFAALRPRAFIAVSMLRLDRARHV